MNKSVKVTSSAQPLSNSFDICPPLSNKLTELGFQLVDDSHKADFLICFNHDPKELKKFLRAGGSKSRAALVRLEPTAVFPAQYKNSIHNKYGFTVTPGRLFSEKSRLAPWPYYYNPNPLQPDPTTIELDDLITQEISRGTFEYDNWNERPILISLIASNKVSPVKDNNYKIRRKLAYQMSDDSLEVYGTLWRSDFKTKIRHRAGVVYHALSFGIFPSLFEVFGNFFRHYPTAKGSIENKHDVTRKSKFSLVVENDNNYVSEKIIDALLGGSIPIYLGGDSQSIGVPSSLAITNLYKAKEIEDFVREIDELRVRTFLSECASWLQSPAFKTKWAGDIVFASIAEDIAEEFMKVGK